MPGCARKDIVREGEVATYHCWSRCVQQTYLCGYDKATGRDFSYRRAWIEDLLAYQARVFAVDVGNFNILSNHAHTILRTRPDIAALWSPEELAFRWKMAWPKLINGQWIREPTDQELDELLREPEKIEEIRKHLSSLSWFMARWKEPIAKQGNAEMDRTGHFWEGRFGCRELLDEAAVLSCSIYVDLNQVQAGMVDKLEDSQHSAIRNRLLAAKRREEQASLEAFAESDPHRQCQFTETEATALFEDCWLAPICANGPLLTAPPLQTTTADVDPVSPVKPTAAVDESAGPVRESEERAPDGHPSRTSGELADAAGSEQPPKPTRSTRKLTRRRASDSPIIDVPWSEYERVLRGVIEFRQLGSSGSAETVPESPVSAALEETLTGWGMNASAWLVQLDQIDGRCTRALGTADHMVQRAAAVAQQWFHGINLCRELFAGASSDEFT